MARRIHEVSIDVDGVPTVFHYRLPSGRMMLKQSDKFKAGTLTNEQSGVDLLTECIVNADGTPVGKERIDEILDEDWDVIQQINALLTPAKQDSEKNV